MGMGTFFRNVAGYPIGDVPEANLVEANVPPGGILYVDDQAVADRMRGQTGLFKLVDPAAALTELQAGRRITGWTGDIAELEQTVKDAAQGGKRKGGSGL